MLWWVAELSTATSHTLKEGPCFGRPTLQLSLLWLGGGSVPSVEFLYALRTQSSKELHERS